MQDDRDVRRADDRPEPSGTPPVGCPLGWRRAALLVVLLHMTFFYHGCDSGQTYFTIGPVVPFAEVSVQGGPSWPSRLLSCSLVAMLAGIVALAAAMWSIRRFFPRLSRLLASRTLLIALSLSVAALNCFLVIPSVWSSITWMPTLYLAEPIEWMLYGDKSTSSVDDRLAIAISARLYFVLLTASLYLIIRLCSYLMRRYLLVEPERWWQFRLGGLIATAVILGTGIGLAVRLIMQSK